MTLLDRVPRMRTVLGRDLLGDSDRAVLRLWLMSRAALLVIAWCGGYLFPHGSGLVPYLSRWQEWDAQHYLSIAAQGYNASTLQTPVEAFFPGLPALIRALHLLGVDYTVAGLVVSALAGAVGAVALARLAEDEPAGGHPREPTDRFGVGQRAVALLVLSPAAVFLVAPYTEALFLGLALPAWLAARRDRWRAAGLLAGGAAAVRISGLFLAVGLVVLFLTTAVNRRRSDPGEGAWLVTPFAVVGAYMIYLYARTGDWLRWVHAQEQGWNREFTWPWEAFDRTWTAAFGVGQPLDVMWMFRLELLATLTGVVLTGWLLRRGRWGEATYVGLSVTALATSTWYFSVPRATLLWFPLWIGLARLTRRRPAVWTGYLAFVAPMMVLVTVAYTTGRWAG